MVAIPITNDQPGVASRIVWTETGDMVAASKLNAAKLRTAIQHVLGHEKYRENARKLQQKIGSRDGVSMAADLIKKVLQNSLAAPCPGLAAEE